MNPLTTFAIICTAGIIALAGAVQIAPAGRIEAPAYYTEKSHQDIINDLVDSYEPEPVVLSSDKFKLRVANNLPPEKAREQFWANSMIEMYGKDGK